MDRLSRLANCSNDQRNSLCVGAASRVWRLSWQRGNIAVTSWLMINAVEQYLKESVVLVRSKTTSFKVERLW